MRARFLRVSLLIFKPTCRLPPAATACRQRLGVLRYLYFYLYLDLVSTGGSEELSPAMEAMEGIAATGADQTYHDPGNGNGPQGSPVRSPVRRNAAESAKRTVAGRSRSKAPKIGEYDILKLLKEEREDMRKERKEDAAESKKILQTELASAVTRVVKLEEATK